MRDQYPHLADIADQFRAIGGKVTWIRDEATGREWGRKTALEGVQPVFDALAWERVKTNPKLGKGAL